MTHLIKHLSFGQDYPGIINPLDDTNITAPQGQSLWFFSVVLQKDIRCHMKAFTVCLSRSSKYIKINPQIRIWWRSYEQSTLSSKSSVYISGKKNVLPKLSCWKMVRQHFSCHDWQSPVSQQLHEGKLVFQQRMPMPMAMKVPNVPPLCIMVFPTPPISSLPRMPILQAEKSF